MFIEACAWWKGLVKRQDLAGLFGVSMAQASSDLQRYLELNPGAFVYNLRQKRYTKPEKVHQLLLDQLGFTLPEQPPPEIRNPKPVVETF